MITRASILPDEYEMALWRRLLRMQVRPGSKRQVRPWDAGEAEFYARSAERPDEIDMLVMARANWVSLVGAALCTVGLTAHELWECSLDDSFPSLRARKLWLAIGHHVLPDDLPAAES